MDKETKAEISRLKSENAFLKELIRNQYKKALEALNFANKGIKQTTDASTKETRNQS